MLEEKLHQLEEEIHSLIKGHYITEQDEFVRNIHILYEMAREKGKYQKEINQVLEKINFEDYKNKIDETIRKTKKLRHKHQHEEAYQLTLLYPNSPIIQGQKFSICLEMNRIEEAYEIASKFANHPRIQSKLCKLYLKQGKYKEVEEIAHRFPSNEVIQSQLLTVYLKQGKYKKVEEMVRRFPSNKVIRWQYNNIKLRQERISSQKAQTLTEMNMYYFREKIYQEYLDHDSMNHIIHLIDEDILHIDPWKKTLMLIAISELRKNKDRMKSIANDYKRNHVQETEHIKVLKRLISENRVIFDQGLYDALLDWNKETNIVKKYIKKN